MKKCFLCVREVYNQTHMSNAERRHGLGKDKTERMFYESVEVLGLSIMYEPEGIRLHMRWRIRRVGEEKE